MEFQLVDYALEVSVTMKDMIWTATSTAALATALGVLWRFFFKPILHLIERTNDFLDDWFGTPARDGVPARKGVMHRLAEVEISKADRSELADLIALITQKADVAEVALIRAQLDEYLDAIAASPAGLAEIYQASETTGEPALED